MISKSPYFPDGPPLNQTAHMSCSAGGLPRTSEVPRSALGDPIPKITDRCQNRSSTQQLTTPMVRHLDQMRGNEISMVTADTPVAGAGRVESGTPMHHHHHHAPPLPRVPTLDSLHCPASPLPRTAT